LHGEFAELNLEDAKVGVLNLDFADLRKQPGISTSLRNSEWKFERVLTNGASFEIVRPAPDHPGADDRVEAFARSARRYDREIYRKLAQAYERDSQQDAADAAWSRHSFIEFLLHSPSALSLSVALGLLLVGGALVARRLHRFDGGPRGSRRVVDGVLLALNLLLPGVIRIGVRKGCEELQTNHIFISYATKDGGEVAFKLLLALETLGKRCWIAPRDVRPAVPYSRQIVNGIRHSCGLVLVLTPGANQSQSVANEVKIAHDERKLIAPLMIRGTQPSDDLTFFLGAHHRIDWTDANSAAVAIGNVLAATQIQVQPSRNPKEVL
jgi:hypothetical protein